MKSNVISLVLMVAAFSTLSILNACKKDPPQPTLPKGWVEMAPMPVAKARHAAVTLNDGRILICGGEFIENTQVRPSKSCEIYNPATNEWIITTPMIYNRILHSILLMYDGRVLVWGGYDSSVGGLEYLKHGEIYDPATEQWTLTASTGVSAPHPILLRFNGKYYVGSSQGVYEYDVPTNTINVSWIYTNGLMNISGMSLCFFPDGSYLSVGGDGPQGAFYTRYVEAGVIYDQLSQGKHSYHGNLILNDSLVLVTGGYDSRKEIFNRYTKQWELLNSSIISMDVNLFLTKPGKAVVFGSHNVAEFDINSRTYTLVPKPENHTWGAGGTNNAVQMMDGNLWICGGWIGSGAPPVFSDKTFVYRAMD